MQKGMGGLGFKDFEAFNVALLARQFWCLLSSPNSLWARILKSLYFPGKSCMEAKRGSRPSGIWCSLLEGRKIIQEGTQWSVGNGERINFWEDPWVPELLGGKVSPLPNVHMEKTMVGDFINPVTKVWDKEKLKTCIPSEEVDKVCKIPVSFSEAEDKVVWRHNSSGNTQ